MVISDEVRALLSTAVIERLLALRQHTEVNCSFCGGAVAPEDPTSMSVVVRMEAATGQRVVQFAHPGCSSSRVDEQTLMRGSDAPRTGYMPLRRVQAPVGVLIWEQYRSAVDPAAGVAENVAFYEAASLPPPVRADQQAGFRPSEDGLARTVGPVLSGWVLRSRGDDLVLDSPRGALQEFEGISSTAPPGWFEAVRSSRRCLLIVGDTLGLERFSPARVSALMADGRAVAAVVLARVQVPA